MHDSQGAAGRGNASGGDADHAYGQRPILEARRRHPEAALLGEEDDRPVAVDRFGQAVEEGDTQEQPEHGDARRSRTLRPGPPGLRLGQVQPLDDEQEREVGGGEEDGHREPQPPVEGGCKGGVGPDGRLPDVYLDQASARAG